MLTIRRYHSHHFALLTRALQQSVKLALMIEESGYLCVQIMMPIGQGTSTGQHSGIIEFKVRSCLLCLNVMVIDLPIGSEHERLAFALDGVWQK